MFSGQSKLLPKKTAIRMALLYALLTTLIMIIVFGLMLYRSKRYFFKNAERHLLHEAKEIGVILKHLDLTAEVQRSFLSAVSGSWQNNIVALSVRDENGAVFYESEELISPELLQDIEYVPIGELLEEDVQPSRFIGHRHTGRLVAFSVPLDDGAHYRCVLAIYPTYIIKGITNIKYTLLWVLLSALVIFFLTGFLLARRTYRPIQRMIQRANEIGSSKLDLRLEGPGTGQELDELANAFNNLFERLRSAFRREEEFNAQVAHELRTPLTGLRGQIESVLLDETISSRHRDALTSAIEAADRLIDLINRLLFLSKAKAGLKSELKAEKVQLNSLVEKVCELVFPDEEERNQRLAVDLPENVECLGDRDMLLRLVMNLIDNAKRHTPPGTPIAIRTGRERDKLKLEVRDGGEGIPEREREKVFDQFFSRIRKGTEERGNGAGLGLSIARTIARLHGGDLTCEETPGGGATFVWEIPV